MNLISPRFLDIHLIQSVPYANLNRDDTNAVKRVFYGGVERTRVSSQCWKRATRPLFEARIGQAGMRTRRFGEHVAATLVEHHGWPLELARLAGQHLTVGSGIDADEPKKKEDADDDEREWRTNALVFFPASGLDDLIELALAHREQLATAKVAKKPKDAVFDTAAIQQILKSRNGVVNMYGRMLAEIDDAGVESAVQVAHAFTTHATETEIDYFAAVDDITDAWGQHGGGHIGDSEYSAGTFYRYATIDLNTLRRNLNGDETQSLARAFLEAFVLSVPGAKRASTAPHTAPSLVHLAVRSDRPVSLARAFEQPVTAAKRDFGYDAPSQQGLAAYAANLGAFLGDAGVLAAGYASVDTGDLEGLGARQPSLPGLVDAAVAAAFGSQG